MTRDRQDRLKEALLRWEQTPAEERDAFWAALEAEDLELAREVRSLVAQPTVRPLETGAMAAAGMDAVRRLGAEPAAAGRQVGPYTLVEVIGVGGMGAVYRAEQREPVRREVAVKLLVGGASLGRIAERFAAEQKALALMDHPGIARLLDAGADSTGTPYIAMELVRGTPITRYGREKALPRREVLALFVAVCRAVQHAHLKGIIHRDLKPSNILVAEVDGKPSVKIIDFGIARIVEGEAGGSPRTLLTSEGQVIGTLEYMSPEQAEGRAKEIDVRTDVYSLGAVLYELLTGALPYDLTNLSLTQAIDVIRRDPPRSFRQTRATGKRIDEDLETITRKALEKEPSRRYDGAGALADDVERYLRSEPIVARPPSTAYQFRTMVRRNRTAVIAGGAVFLFLAIFGVTMTVLYGAQSRERERAEGEARKAEAVSDFLQRMLASANPELMGRDVTVREVTDQSLRELGTSFPRHPDVHAVIEGTLGRTYASLGQMNRADSLLRVGYERHRRAKGDHDLGTIAILRERASLADRRSQFTAAESLGREAYRLASQVTGPRTLEGVLCLRVWARAQRSLSPARAESLLLIAEASTRAWPEANVLRAEIIGDLAETYDHLNRPAEAERFGRQALSLLESELGRDDARLLKPMTDLMFRLYKGGRFEEALTLGRRGTTIAERRYGFRHPRTASLLQNMAHHLTALGRYADAETLLARCARIFVEAYGEAHPSVVSTYSNIGFLHSTRGDHATASEWFARAVTIADQLDPTEYSIGLVTHGNLIDSHIRHGRTADAIAATKRLGALVADREARRGAVRPVVYGMLGIGYRIAADYAESEKYLRRAVRGLQDNRVSAAAIADHQMELALTLRARGQGGEADSLVGIVGGGRPLPSGPINYRRGLARKLADHYRSIGDERLATYYRGLEATLPR